MEKGIKRGPEAIERREYLVKFFDRLNVVGESLARIGEAANKTPPKSFAHCNYLCENHDKVSELFGEMFQLPKKINKNEYKYYHPEGCSDAAFPFDMYSDFEMHTRRVSPSEEAAEDEPKRKRVKVLKLRTHRRGASPSEETAGDDSKRKKQNMRVNIKRIHSSAKYEGSFS